MSDSDGDEWHAWSGSDETIDITVSAGATVRFYLSWPKVLSAASRNYDLYLFEKTSSGSLDRLEKSVSWGNIYEKIVWTNGGSSSKTVHLSVRARHTTVTDFEVFMSGSGTWTEHNVSSGSTTSPSNATDSLVISVGAVVHTSYTSPSAPKSYSGRGRSNDGMRLPDLTGPTDTSVSTGAFGGTSCATPNAAGTAAVLWSCDTSVAAADVADQLFAWASGLKDFGAAGADNDFGRGGIYLPPCGDCNRNDEPDACEILTGAVADADSDGVPDLCGLFTILRGDINGDGVAADGISEAVFLFRFNFLGGLRPPCLAAADVNGDGVVRGVVTDGIYLLAYSFLGGPPPAEPFPACGPAALPDDAALGCDTLPLACQ